MNGKITFRKNLSDSILTSVIYLTVIFCLLLGKAGILLFQPTDWDHDGTPDLIAADRDGFIYLIPGKGKWKYINHIFQK